MHSMKLAVCFATAFSVINQVTSGLLNLDLLGQQSQYGGPTQGLDSSSTNAQINSGNGADLSALLSSVGLVKGSPESGRSSSPGGLLPLSGGLGGMITLPLINGLFKDIGSSGLLSGPAGGLFGGSNVPSNSGFATSGKNSYSGVGQTGQSAGLLGGGNGWGTPAGAGSQRIGAGLPSPLQEGSFPLLSGRFSIAFNPAGYFTFNIMPTEQNIGALLQAALGLGNVLKN